MNQQDELIRNIVDKTTAEFNKSLDENIKSRLKSIGIEFEGEKDFNEFCSSRLTITHFKDEPNHKELYLDFDTENQMLILWWDTTINIAYEDGKVNITIG